MMIIVSLMLIHHSINYKYNRFISRNIKFLSTGSSQIICNSNETIKLLNLPIQDQIKFIRTDVKLSLIVSKLGANVKKFGSSKWICLCPFHNDTRPSLQLQDDKGYYRCYACGAGGSIINYIMYTQNLSYQEAIKCIISLHFSFSSNVDKNMFENDIIQKMLVPRSVSNLQSLSSTPASNKSKQSLSLTKLDSISISRNYELHEIATSYYQQQLYSELSGAKNSRSYIEKRVLPNTLIKCRFGYAPSLSSSSSSAFPRLQKYSYLQPCIHNITEKRDEIILRPSDNWETQSLTMYLKKRGFTSEELVAAGVSIRSEDGSSLYDRFRNRLIIPLRDINGRVIAFGGRMMSEEKSLNKDNYIPKYINSPTSNLYLKRAYLYGLDSASDHIPKKKWALVVEGYFDVIALQEAGIECSLACCGTSLTKEQIELVSKIVGADGMIILLLDTDEAGEQAIERLCLQVLSGDSNFILLNIKVASLKCLKDPLVANHLLHRLEVSGFYGDKISDSINIEYIRSLGDCKDPSDLCSAIMNKSGIWATTFFIDTIVEAAEDWRVWLVHRRVLIRMVRLSNRLIDTAFNDRMTQLNSTLGSQPSASNSQKVIFNSIKSINSFLKKLPEGDLVKILNAANSRFDRKSSEVPSKSAAASIDSISFSHVTNSSSLLLTQDTSSKVSSSAKLDSKAVAMDKEKILSTVIDPSRDNSSKNSSNLTQLSSWKRWTRRITPFNSLKSNKS